MIADNYGCVVKTCTSKEGPALGAAILAGVGAGIYMNVEEACEKMIKFNAPEPPNAGNVEKYEQIYGVYKQLYKDVKETYKDLKEI